MKFYSAVSPKDQKQSPCKFFRRAIGCVLSASLFLSLSGCSLVGYHYESPMMDEKMALNQISPLYRMKEFDRDFDRYMAGKSTAVFKKLFLGNAYAHEYIRKNVYGSVSHYYTFQTADCSLLVLFSKKEDKIIGLRRPIYKKIEGFILPYYRDVSDTKDMYTGELVYAPDYMRRRRVSDVIEDYMCRFPRERLKNFAEYGADPARIDEMNKATGYIDSCSLFTAALDSSCLKPLE
ncbi:MAG: hypothetical protein J5934_07685 [Succinivibrio sp.]|nr:hypothetical protein [Succinivibrio sp.]